MSEEAVATTQPALSFSATGLVVSGEVTYEIWMEALLRAVSMRSALTWAIGDLVIYGQAAYGETYAQAEAATGMDYATLKNVAYVARAVPPAERKIELTWRHHYLTASMEAEERQTWLQRAIDERMNTEELRVAIRDARQAALAIEEGAHTDAPLLPEPASEPSSPGEVLDSLTLENATIQVIEDGAGGAALVVDVMNLEMERAIRGWLERHPRARVMLIDDTPNDW